MGEQDKTTNGTETAASLPPSAAQAAPATLPAAKGDGPVEGSDALPKAG
jgi:hypothetical protein